MTRRPGKPHPVQGQAGTSTLPAESQVGRRAAEARARKGQMDGCPRQDPAYRPATGGPRLGGALFYSTRAAACPAAHSAVPEIRFRRPGRRANMESTARDSDALGHTEQETGERRLLSSLPPADRPARGEGVAAGAMRCPHCRLLVGVGRARPTSAAEPGARGSAAGVFAHEAKRSGGGQDSSNAEICAAIRKVADAAGRAPRAAADGRLPAVRVGLTTTCPALSEVIRRLRQLEAGSPGGRRAHA